MIDQDRYCDRLFSVSRLAVGCMPVGEEAAAVAAVAGYSSVLDLP